MPQPTLRQGSFNLNVTNLAIAYAQTPEQGAGWARRLAPLVPVDSDRGTYKIVNKGDWFRNIMARRAPGTAAVAGGYALSDGTYQAERWSLRFNVTDEDKRLKPQIWADKRAAKFLQQKAMISADVLATTNLLTAGVGWTTELVGASSAVANTSVIGWSLANSTPVADITDGIEAVTLRTGSPPTAIGISPDVVKVLRRHSDFTGRMGGATADRPAVVSFAAMEEILGVAPGTIFTMGTIVNTAAAGQTATMAYACPETLFIGNIQKSPDVETPSAAATFVFSDIDGLAQDGAVSIRTWRDEENGQDAYEADLYHDVKLTAADCGYLFTSILS